MWIVKTSSARPSNRRVGGSLFQVLTCLLAAGVGAWAGAQYLGVRVEDVAYTALDKADVLDKLPEDWRPELSECPTNDCPPPVSQEERAAELREELNGLRQEVATLRNAVETGGEFPPLAGSEAGNQARREQTLAYWSRLVEIVGEVARLDDEVQPAVSAASNGHVFDIRRRSFEYAQRAIEAIPQKSVDIKAIEGAQRLAGWYGEGAGFYAEAISVWDGLVGAERPSRTAQDDLDRSRRHQTKQTELLRAKLAEVASSLSRRYAVQFPAIDL